MILWYGGDQVNLIWFDLKFKTMIWEGLNYKTKYDRRHEQLLFSCLWSKVSIYNYITCHISHVTCHISHVTCHMSYVKSLCWSLGHAENFLFSCLGSKVAHYGPEKELGWTKFPIDDFYSKKLSREFAWRIWKNLNIWLVASQAISIRRFLT